LGDELRHVVGEDYGMVAGARDGNVRKSRVEQVWVNAGVGVNEDALGGKPLRAVAGDSIAVVEMRMLTCIPISSLLSIVYGHILISYNSILRRWALSRASVAAFLPPITNQSNDRLFQAGRHYLETALREPKQPESTGLVHGSARLSDALKRSRL
jgi:hypothetical protein